MTKFLVSVDDSDYLLPTPVQAAYQADIQNRITTAVSNINGVAQAVADKVAPLTTDGQVAPLLNSATNTRNALDGRYYYAPAPSGGDDTSVLQALALTAQSTRGTVELRDGTYQANIATAQSFIQPRIIGQGENRTILKPFDLTKPAIKFQGGSGVMSGGYYSDLTIAGPTSGTAAIGVELADVCGVRWDRVRFTGNITRGIYFHVTQDAGFTEFCAGQADFDTTVTTALHYRTERGNESSFHGSGLTGTSTINSSSAAGAIIIEANCFPYNAPLSATVFTHTAAQNVIANRNTSRAVSFYGTLRVENQSGGYIVLGDLAGNTIYYVGERSVLGSQTYLGDLYFARKVYYSGGTTYALRDTFTRALTLGPNTSCDLTLPQGATADITVNITAPNYAAWYRLVAWQNPFNGSGTVTVLAGSVYNNGTNVGAPTFTVSNYALVISNPGYTSAYTAVAAITDGDGNIGTDSLRQ